MSYIHNVRQTYNVNQLLIYASLHGEIGKITPATIVLYILLIFKLKIV